MLTSKETTANLSRMIKPARCILVISHRDPDHDAICSMLLVKHFLEKYLGKKNVEAVVQEDDWPWFTSFDLPGIDSVMNVPKSSDVDLSRYDLVIIVDSDDISRCVNVKKGSHSNIVLIAIDHHPPSPPFGKGSISPDLLINERRSSAVEQVFSSFQKIKPAVKKDPVTAKLVQIGIISDTNRFLFNELLSLETFEIFGELFEFAPVNIEHVYYKLIGNTRNSIQVFGHILENTVFKEDFVYSHISQQFISDKKFTEKDRESARAMFLQFYVRTLEGIDWGFIVRKSSSSNTWHVSFRATTGTQEVKGFAEALGGGGHLYAAGAEFAAKDEKEAVKKVLAVVEKS